MAKVGFIDSSGRDVAEKYVTKDYIISYYPDLIDSNRDPVLWSWGANSYGQLGIGTTVSRSSPGSVGTGINWQQTSTGGGGISFSFGVKTDGTLWTWGDNSFYALGDGTSTNRSTPGTVSGGGTTWKQVSAGGLFGAAVKTDGTLFMWGQNGGGELGNGDTKTRSVPTSTAGGGSNWQFVSCGNISSSAIKSDGTLWSWGQNTKGQLGDGSITNRSSPVTVSGGGTTWNQVSAGFNHVLALKTDNSIWSWGDNSYGGLGDGTTTNRSSPVTVAGGGSWETISAGYLYSAAIKMDGTLWTWGYNEGQLGDGTALTSKSSPETVAGGGTLWKKVSCGYKSTFAIKVDGSLWSWGVGISGQLGDGATTNKSSPATTAAGTNYSWKSVGIGSNGQDFTLAIAEKGGW